MKGHARDLVAAALEGRAVLLTGGSGFVGKVLLEKVLRCFAGVRKVFLLVRPSKGRSAAERVKSEIVQSEVFSELVKQIGKAQFESLCAEKLVALSGDITLPRLGLSDDAYAQLVAAHVEVFIHCAASVNFDDPLEVALELNTRGALAVMELAQALGHCRAFVHVSTAYVTANLRDGVAAEEKIYPLSFDPEAVLEESRRSGMSGKNNNKVSTVGLNRLQLRIQGNFPNTYTLTKAMGEVMLERYRGDLPLAVVRPSIVGASWREPVPGWVDVVSAASAVFMAASLGVVTLLPGNPRGVAAIVPVDYVANHILLALADIFDQRGELRVSHCCTSTINPVRWRVVSTTMLKAYEKHIPSAKLVPGPVKFRMVQNRQQFAAEWALRYDLPTALYSQFAQIAGSGSTREMAGKLELLRERSLYVVDLFEPFTSTAYQFDCGQAMRWATELEGAAAGAGNPLSVDPSELAWDKYFSNYAYGLNRFILREDLVPVSASAVEHTNLSLSLGRLLEWDGDHHRISFPGLISDISWAYTSSRKPGYTRSGVLGRLMGITGWREGLAHEAKHVPRAVQRTTEAMRRLVLKSPAVKKAIKDHARAHELSRKQATDLAAAYFTEIASTLQDGPPRAFGWFLRKVFRTIFSGVRVHEAGVEQLRAVVAAAEYPVVLVPTHRSYVDFLLLSFIAFALNLPVPHIASSTDFLGMGAVSRLLRASGAFFLRRDGSFQDDPLYAAVFNAYTQQLLLDRQQVEFYVEGTRSRTGKSIAPKAGIVQVCLEPVLDGRLKDVVFVPISIDYEKCVEAAIYSEEMLGSSKPKETLENLLKSVMVLGKKFGHVSVQFGKHISARDFLEKHRSVELQSLSTRLGYDIVEAHHAASVCMPVHLVATSVLWYRHGMTLDQLVQSVEWLRLQVIERGGYVAGTEGEHRVELVKNAIDLLGPVLMQRRSPRVFQVNSSQKEYLNMIVLGYYRNKIVHLFEMEALWAVALYAHWATSAYNSDSASTNANATEAFMSPPPHMPAVSRAFANASAPNQVGGKKGLSLDDFLSPTQPRPSGTERRVHVQKESMSDSIQGLLEAVQKDVLFLDSMLEQEFVRGRDDAKSNVFLALQRLKDSSVIAEESGRLYVSDSQESQRQFSLLCSIAWPFIDSYYVAASALTALLPDAKTNLANLLERMAMLAENFFHDRVIMHYEACSKNTLQNALEAFSRWGVINFSKRKFRKAKKGRTAAPPETVVSLCPSFTDRAKLDSLIHKIDSLRGPRLARSRGISKSVADFPMLASL